jgi:hypothetical protein
MRNRKHDLIAATSGASTCRFLGGASCLLFGRCFLPTIWAVLPTYYTIIPQGELLRKLRLTSGSPREIC